MVNMMFNEHIHDINKEDLQKRIHSKKIFHHTRRIKCIKYLSVLIFWSFDFSNGIPCFIQICRKIYIADESTEKNELEQRKCYSALFLYD